MMNQYGIEVLDRPSTVEGFFQHKKHLRIRVAEVVVSLLSCVNIANECIVVNVFDVSSNTKIPVTDLDTEPETRTPPQLVCEGISSVGRTSPPLRGAIQHVNSILVDHMMISLDMSGYDPLCAIYKR